MTYFQGSFKPRVFPRSQVVPAIPEQKFYAGEKNVTLKSGQRIDVESTIKLSVYSASIDFPRTTINIKAKSGSGSAYIGLNPAQWADFVAFITAFDTIFRDKQTELSVIEQQALSKSQELKQMREVMEMAQAYQQNTPQES